VTHAVGFEQGRPVDRLAETLKNESAGMTDRNRPTALAEGIVIETRKDVALFDRRPQPLVETMLRTLMNDEISP
jgi:hypothetical protein